MMVQAVGRAAVEHLSSVPEDFEVTFIAKGRTACEEHYCVGKKKITGWLEEAGKDRLLKLRAEHVRSTVSNGQTLSRPSRRCPPDFDVAFVRLGPKGCERRFRCGHYTVRRWLNERGLERLTAERAAFTTAMTRSEATTILRGGAKAPSAVNQRVVRHAAQYLRMIRNGGWIISPATNGLWWVGSRRRTASDLVELAIAKGFDPNLTLGA